MSAQRPYELARNAIWNILVLAPARDARANFQFNVDVAKWRSESLEPLTQLYIQLEYDLNEGVFSKHVEALKQTVSACRQPLRASLIVHDSQMPTTDQLCGVLRSGRPLVFDQHYGPHGGWLDPEPQTRVDQLVPQHATSAQSTRTTSYPASLALSTASTTRRTSGRSSSPKLRAVSP
ncbi:hypothetical protein BJY59DRAFT_545371 [Rhodotorula toruloides]